MKSADLLPAPERLELMKDGLRQLKTWLEDLIRTGILSFDFSPENLREIASRMVDSKLGSIGKRLRLLAEIDRSSLHWPHQITAELAYLYLIVIHFEKWEGLSWKMKHTTLALCGYNLRSEQLLTLPGIKDIWRVAGQRTYPEENLQVRKTWVAGIVSARFALILDFAFGNAAFQQRWEVGKAYQGELVYYPGSMNLRGMIKQPAPYQHTPAKLPAYATIYDFVDQYAKAIVKNLWLTSFPCSLREMLFVPDQERFVVVDSNKHFIPVQNNIEPCWNLFAFAGGKPIRIFGEWNGTSLQVLSYQKGDSIQPFA